MVPVREAIDAYRRQSAAHFALHIDVQPLMSSAPPDHINVKSKLRLTFQNYFRRVDRVCRLDLRNGRPSSAVFTRERGRWISLADMLAIHFPMTEANTSNQTLQDYWDHNGNRFPWERLPTELKEHVIRFCLLEAAPYRDKCIYVAGDLQGAKRRCRTGAHELNSRFGDWNSLLRVSIQVRAIALRLCLSGRLVRKMTTLH